MGTALKRSCTQPSHILNGISNWTHPMFDESYEELVHTPLEKRIRQSARTTKERRQSDHMGSLPGWIKDARVSQIPLAFANFNDGCHLFKENLVAKPNFVLRLVVREFGAKGWRNFEIIRQHLFGFILRMTISVLGSSRPLSLALRGFLNADTFHNSAESALKVLIDSGKKDLGAGHKEVFRLMRGLSVVYRSWNDLQLSEQTLQAAIKASEAINGVKNDQTRRCLSRLANHYGDQDRYAEVEAIYEHVLRGMDSVNDGLDDITIYTFQNLAKVAKQ
jgi:hypothetical protein